MAGKSVAWQIEHQCPQCGAQVSLEETDHLLTCSYCRTKLYITARNELRFCLPPHEAVTADILYIPYWRLKGISYSLDDAGVDFRHVDTSLLATETGNLPASLGVRSQALALKYAYAAPEGRRFLKALVSKQELIRRMDTPSLARLRHVFIGEMISIIYAPAYIDGGILYDAILRRPVCTWEMSDLDLICESDGHPDWQIQFVGTLCPSCGWNLEGEGDALVLICRNCASAWICPQNSLERQEFAMLPGSSDPLTYLPFWRLKARIEGIALETEADLIRLANLPRAVTKSAENNPFYFWCPAFKIYPAILLRWMRQMTSLQPVLVESAPSLRASLQPVNLGAGEALESITVTLGSLIADKRKLNDVMSGIRIIAGETLLVYHPFTIGMRELIHETLNLTIDRQALAYGGFL